MCDAVMDTSGWDQATSCYDTLIESMPLGVVVGISRPLHELFMRQTNGKSMWSDLCVGAASASAHWRQGLQVFFRVQVLMAPDRTMKRAQDMYTELHKKAIALAAHSSEFRASYPEATHDMCERLMCLMSDIMCESLEIKPHLALNDDQHASASADIMIQFWHVSDGDDDLPIIVYVDRMPPIFMMNSDREDEEHAAVLARIPNNGFMMHGKPSHVRQQFQVDMFDLAIRKPLVAFLNTLIPPHGHTASHASSSASAAPSTTADHEMTSADDGEASPSHMPGFNLSELD